MMNKNDVKTKCKYKRRILFFSSSSKYERNGSRIKLTWRHLLCTWLNAFIFRWASEKWSVFLKEQSLPNFTRIMIKPFQTRSVRVAERLALPTSDHGVVGSNPAGGEILPEPKRRFIAQSLSCSSFHRLEMTEILLKGRKTLTHPSILSDTCK